MKCVLVYLFVVFGFCWESADGSSPPRFAYCSGLKEINCSYLFPGSSCMIKSLWYADLPCTKINESLDGAILDNQAPALADINIEAYQYLNLRTYPNLNVSFSSIKFTSVLVKVTVLEPNKTKSVCKNFTIHNYEQDLTKPSVLFYDCRWFENQSQYILYPMTFEYKMTNRIYSHYKKFYFKLPHSGKIDIQETDPKDFQLLIYMEDDGQCIKFHWSKPPKKYRALYYRVTLHDLTDNVTMPYNTSETYMSFCAIPKAHNKYNISVEPWLLIGANHAFGSPSFSEQFRTTASTTGISIVILVVFFILLLITLLLLCWCATLLYFWEYLSVARKKNLKKCILVFEPSCKRHLAVVKEIVLFLRSLQVPVLYAETDIKKNEFSTDWYGRELNLAEVILIVSNPCPTAEISTASIHYNIYKTGFVRERLRDITLTGTTSRRFIKILLPYCKEEDFYCFIDTIPSYHIIQNRFRLLQDIMGLDIWLPGFLAWPLYSPYFKTEAWRRLESAIKEFHFHSDTKMNEIEMESDNHSLTKTSFTSDDEIDKSGVEDRKHELEQYMDDNSSDSENELPPTSACDGCSNNNTDDNRSISEMAMDHFR